MQIWHYIHLVDRLRWRQFKESYMYIVSSKLCDYNNYMVL